jgi:GT2 family glycosyltransferase
VARISAILVNHNGEEFIGDSLASLEHQRRTPDEAVVVDNASVDASVALIRSRFPWVRVIELERNVGFAEGNNIGQAATDGEYVALLNSDACADPGWLSELAEPLDLDQTLAATVPKIYRAGLDGTIEQAGAEFNNLGHSWTRGFNQRDHGQFDTPGEVAVLTACSALIRRASLCGQPLFDPSFFMYYEEVELSLRLRGAGHGIFYVPSATVSHVGMRSVRHASSRPQLFQQSLCNRNRLKIVAKYFPPRVLLSNLPLILLSAAYWDLQFARNAGIGYSIRAIRDQWRYTLRGLAERRQVRDVDAGRWVPWMTRHGVADALRIHRSRDA